MTIKVKKINIVVLVCEILNFEINKDALYIVGRWCSGVVCYQEKITRLVDEINVDINNHFVANEEKNKDNFMFALYKCLKKSETFVELQELLKEDSFWENVSLTQNYHGQPQNIIIGCLVNSVNNYDNIEVDADKVLANFNELRDVFGSTELVFEFRNLILGIDLKENSQITDDLSLVKLNSEESQQRRMMLEKAYPNQITGPINLAVEARLKVKISESSSVSLAFSEANKKAQTIFGDFLKTMYISVSYVVRLGPLEYIHWYFPTITSFNYLEDISIYKSVLLESKDVDIITNNYLLFSSTQDQVIRLAITRFCMGKERKDKKDRIVDYVIALESILLTVAGCSPSSELSYRFALNGSSILNKSPLKIKRQEGLEIMRCLYQVRSAIVHGNSTDQINKKASRSSIGVSNLNELSEKAEDILRNTIMWILRMDPKDRPYVKMGAWEEMLFN